MLTNNLNATRRVPENRQAPNRAAEHCGGSFDKLVNAQWPFVRFRRGIIAGLNVLRRMSDPIDQCKIIGLPPELTADLSGTARAGHVVNRVKSDEARQYCAPTIGRIGLELRDRRLHYRREIFHSRHALGLRRAHRLGNETAAVRRTVLLADRVELRKGRREGEGIGLDANAGVPGGGDLLRRRALGPAQHVAKRSGLSLPFTPSAEHGLV